jgi:hypothetical protein
MADCLGVAISLAEDHAGDPHQNQDCNAHCLSNFQTRAPLNETQSAHFVEFFMKVEYEVFVSESRTAIAITSLVGREKFEDIVGFLSLIFEILLWV